MGVAVEVIDSAARPPVGVPAHAKTDQRLAIDA